MNKNYNHNDNESFMEGIYGCLERIETGINELKNIQPSVSNSAVKNEANEPQLPQTGEANTSAIGLLGMLVAGFAAILGFESSRSRKHKN